MTIEQYYSLAVRRSGQWAERHFPRSVAHLMRELERNDTYINNQKTQNDYGNE